MLVNHCVLKLITKCLCYEFLMVLKCNLIPECFLDVDKLVSLIFVPRLVD